MTFRGRLRVFFTIIVIIPMIAVGLALFTLTKQSETGKADAGIAVGFRIANGLYGDARDRARPPLRRVVRDPALRTALAHGDPGAIRLRLDQLVRTVPGARAIVYVPAGPRRAVRAGDLSAVAPLPVNLTGRSGGALGTLAVSATPAARLSSELSRLSGYDATVSRGDAVLAATIPGARPAPGNVGDFHFGGTEYRGRSEQFPEPGAQAVRVSVFEPAHDLLDSLARSRALVFGILLGFLLLALASSIFVVRALQDQIGQFLEAARRLARGEFAQPVPIEGHDEFAQLGTEFNKMSEQLETKIDEVERKRRELEDTIRRVGEAFATGLDPQSVVDLAVRTAVEACEAAAGRALPLDERRLRAATVGPEDKELEAAMEAAERAAFAVRPETGAELLERPAPSPAASPTPRRAVQAGVEDVHAIAVPMRARLASHTDTQDVGVISIARRDRPFDQADRELLEYLAGQASVSIENADLHETVQLQAVTDELTGLANVRELHGALDRELERSRRFGSPLGLVMLDLDDFKQINDTHGHQQGDEVLAAVAHVLRTLSRDIDVPARYGGEELCVVAPQTDAPGAVQLAERMREAIEVLRVKRVDGAGELPITASFGVAAIPDSADDKDTLIAAADAALYRAKRAGKNRVERAEPVAASR